VHFAEQRQVVALHHFLHHFDNIQQQRHIDQMRESTQLQRIKIKSKNSDLN
jgi:hypothetical protein